MSKYNSTFAVTNKRKSKRGLKIFLSIVILIIVVLGILFALHYKTVMLALGKGSLKVNKAQTVEKAMAASGNFKNVSDKVDASGNTTVTGVTKDGAVSYTVTQQKSGKETVIAQVDLSKLDTKGISKSAILHGNTSAIQKAKSEADDYLTPIVGKDQATGIETYIANQAIQQSKSNSNAVNINHNFGSTNIQISGNLSTKNVTVKMTQ